MTDNDKIVTGIDEAQRDGREISDKTARIIAAQWHGGQASDLYAFVSTGAIAPDMWQRELLAVYNRHADIDGREQLDWLGTYLTHHGPREPVAHWSLLTSYGEA